MNPLRAPLVVSDTPLVPLIDPDALRTRAAWEQPEKGLLAQILTLAIEEARGQVIGRERDSACVRIQRQADAWLRDRTANYWGSAAFIFEQLGLDHGAVIARLPSIRRVLKYTARRKASV